MESLYFGVPMLGFPIYLDQPTNSRKMELFGVGMHVPPLSSSNEILHQILQIIDEGSSY